TSHEESEDSEEEDDDNDGGDHDGDQDAAKPETEEAEGDSVPEEGKGPQGSPPKVEVDNKLDVCETVATALTGSLKEACEQKYQYGKERFPNWKCIPSGDKTATSGGESGETTARGPSRQRRNADPAKASGTNQGSICVPPRRRKLYVGHLEKWAKTSGSNTQARGSEPQASESSQGTTKAKSPQGGVESQGQTPSQSDNKLLEAFIQSAAIETFFAWYEFKKEKEKEEKEKAQLVVNTSSVEENLQNQLKKGEIPEEFKRQMFYTFGDYRDIFFGKDVGGDMDTVNQKITALFKKNGQSIEEQLKQWWKTYGENIWEGMVCALSYNTDTKQMNKDIKTNLTSLEKNNNYTNVTFPSESGSGSGTKLLEFSKTPQFVRWFEEWGEEFCRIRNHKLQKVKKECRGENIGDKYCDGDGYDCTDKDKLRCQKECIKYKKWIVNKRNEFNKQKKKFENEIKTVNGTNEDKYDEEVYKNPKLMYPTFQKFVPRLNECPYCINSKVGGQIDFKKNGETFGSSEYCKACPVYGVKYIRGQYQRINKNALNTEIDNNPTEIDVVILDRKGYDKDNDLDKACMNTGLFENSSFQKWICQYLNKTDQCKLTNFSGDIDDDTEMEFNVFFQQWLRYFVQDYNKLKDKVNACIKNHDEKSNKCIKGCKDKCDCVEKWLKIKKTEWDNVKEHFKKRKSIYDYDIPYWVKSFFKREPFESDYQKSQEVVEDPNKRDELWGCTGENIEDGEKPENCDKGDFITQLIDKLKKKIAQCKEKHIETTDKPCNETLPELPFLTPDEPLDDYYIQQPKICPPPMTCVEKIAKELREEAEKSLDNIDSSLKVDRTIFTKDCNKVIKQNGAPNGDACDFEKTYKTSLDSLKEPCKGKEKERFNIGNIWNCKYINKIRKDICIPPRKKYMCIQNFKNITTRDVTNSTQLLQKLQEVAQNEGDDIIKSLLPENSCNEYVICDAMKYSFADIGDIIRGRDLWNNNIKPGIQTRLEYIFGNIYKSLKGENEKKYKDDFPLYYKLRSDWWDANRKEVWKAMTCNAPKDAHLKKKTLNNSGHNSHTTDSIRGTQEKCGHNTEPPDYDYIPQPFRFMQEWSEYYCKLLKEQIKIFEKECSCKKEGNTCTNDIEKCKNCRDQCKKYKELIDEWKNQFGKYKKIYKEIYNNKDSSKTKEYVKEFLQKLKNECEDPQTADTYIDKTSYCTDFNFVDNKQTNSTYAFKTPPKGYENACKCEPPDQLNNCPMDDTTREICKRFEGVFYCSTDIFQNKLSEWTDMHVMDSDGKNKGVLVPPRRRQLCIKTFRGKKYKNKDANIFKNDLLNASYSQGRLLAKIYSKYDKECYEAMQYSFYDYGDIIKGTDMYDNITSKGINLRLTELLNGSNNGPKDAALWWDNNKNKVWYAMLCGYKSENRNGNVKSEWCKVPTHDGTHQFLRWLLEWAKQACKEKEHITNSLKTKCYCTNGGNYKASELLRVPSCQSDIREYISLNILIKNSMKKLNIKYQQLKDQSSGNIPNELSEKNVQSYIKSKYSECKLDLNDIYEISTGKKNYENNEFKEVLQKLCPNLNFVEDEPDKSKVPDTSKKEEITPVPPDEPDTPPPVQPPQADEPFNRDILEKTIPFGIAFALGSIAFLFLK
ncbi:hypothetical protein PFTANZ_03633, partial [Plasmodium falciparum Tanzania (2000708)]